MATAATASSAITYARQNQDRFLNELFDLLRIPSVSTLPGNVKDVERAAQFVADEMRRIGLEHDSAALVRGALCRRRRRSVHNDRREAAARGLCRRLCPRGDRHAGCPARDLRR